MAHTVIYGLVEPETIGDPATYSPILTDSLGKLILSEDSNISATITNEFATEGTLDLVKDNLDDIKSNTNKLPRVGGVIHSDATITAGTSTPSINMGEYNVIQLSGRIPYESSFDFVLQFGRQDVGNWYSDNIRSDIKRLGTTPYATFSLTRTNICHQYVRMYNLVGGDNIFVEYDLLKN